MLTAGLDNLIHAPTFLWNRIACELANTSATPNPSIVLLSNILKSTRGFPILSNWKPATSHHQTALSASASHDYSALCSGGRLA